MTLFEMWFSITGVYEKALWSNHDKSYCYGFQTQVNLSTGNAIYLAWTEVNGCWNDESLIMSRRIKLYTKLNVNSAL